MWQFVTDVKRLAIYTSLYNDGNNDRDMEWATVTRKVHCSQESLYDVYHFVKLLDSDLVRATVAGRTNRGLSKFVNKKWSTIFNWNCAWMCATGATIAKADLSGNFIIIHCRMSTIQPAWPVYTKSVCWHTRCWHFSSCSSHKTIPSHKELVVTKYWINERCIVTAFSVVTTWVVVIITWIS